MATYNGQAYIAEQLESILTQSLLPAEIVIADDASTDDTVGIAHEVVADRVPLMVLANPEPVGVAANFERAIAATSHPLIALSDQDDRWHPDRLATMVPVFAARPELLLLHGDARLVDAAGQPLGHTLFEALEVSARERHLVHSGEALRAFLCRNLVTGATVLFRRSLLELARPFPNGWVHDEWLGIIAAAHGVVDMVEEPLIDYRQHGGNQIGATKPSLGTKVGRVLREPRQVRNDRLLANFGALHSRLQSQPLASRNLMLARAKLEHERMRHGLPAARILRTVPVLRALARGRYRSFSRGGVDALRDLLQPAR